MVFLCDCLRFHHRQVYRGEENKAAQCSLTPVKSLSTVELGNTLFLRGYFIRGDKPEGP